MSKPTQKSKWLLRRKIKTGYSHHWRYVSQITKTGFKYTENIAEALRFSNYEKACNSMSTAMKFGGYLPHCQQ